MQNKSRASPSSLQRAYELDLHRDLKEGLTRQRELFKEAKRSQDYESMRTAIENIKSEIKGNATKMQRAKVIKEVELIISWYDNIDFACTKKTPDGPQIHYPPNLPIKINKNLVIAYEKLMTLQYEMELV